MRGEGKIIDRKQEKKYKGKTKLGERKERWEENES